MGRYDPHSPFLRGKESAEWKDKLQDPYATLLTRTVWVKAQSAEEELHQHMKQVSRRPGYAHLANLLQHAYRKH